MTNTVEQYMYWLAAHLTDTELATLIHGFYGCSLCVPQNESAMLL